MIIDHVTIHVELGTHTEKGDELLNLLGLLGYIEEEPHEHGVPDSATVTWWRFPFQPSTPLLHLIETIDGEQDNLALGHICIVLNDPKRFEEVEKSPWCVRSSGSGRCWVEFAGLRLEVHP